MTLWTHFGRTRNWHSLGWLLWYHCCNLRWFLKEELLLKGSNCLIRLVQFWSLFLFFRLTNLILEFGRLICRKWSGLPLVLIGLLFGLFMVNLKGIWLEILYPKIWLDTRLMVVIKWLLFQTQSVVSLWLLQHEVRLKNQLGFHDPFLNYSKFPFLLRDPTS